ncbi:HNH endonuclease [Blastococcus sp. TF02-09]|uniref:HNH endonuclease signature motif containing protein n=1 Tax=Blastococcus sp. TF02-09 TaxID=2250576 RepID=UPI000DEB679A|nr:HNH endonuclease signature motif containing protein [Blastococcus sp. TF02-9]RBY81160.1 HNH endonuclease [Blastococcus sp. TF02-9]
MSVAELDPSPEGGLVEWWLWRAPSVERFPVEQLSAEEVTLELQRVQARKAMDAAYEAELVMALAAARPDADDPPPGHPGARRRAQGSPVPGTSEFLPDELALVLNCGRPFATQVLSDAHQLVERMPAVHAARAAGQLDDYRARVFADVLGTASDEVVAVVVPAVLPLAAGLSAATLRRRLVAAAEAADEEFAERRRVEAERRAAVRLYPTADGMSVLATEAPAAVAAAMWSTIDQAAQLARTGGDDRPIGVLRTEAHAALVLRPWDTSRPTMTGHLTLTAPLSALRPPGHPRAAAHPAAGQPATADESGAPGEADERVARAAAGAAVPSVQGTPITAAHLRELLTQLGALGVTAPAGGSLAVALTDDQGTLLATATASELAGLAGRGCAQQHPDLDCDCPVLGPPPEVPGYAHTAAQERFARLRDRTCRHPGCGQPAGRTDLDHVLPYDCGGRTACQNLCCLCRSHHRLKTFARNWRFRMGPDGTLTVTTPSGITRTTRPPGLHEQRALPPPRPAPVDESPPPF